jgi:hypothetical protein
MVKGHESKKVDSYKQTRLLMFTMARLMGDPKSAPKTPSQLWELPGDELDDNSMSESDIKEIFKRLM